MDADIRTLQRAYELNPENEWARYRYAKALQRLGRLDELRPLREGDVVEVREVDAPKARWPWQGRLCDIFDEGDAYATLLLEPVQRFHDDGQTMAPPTRRPGDALYITSRDVENSVILEPALPVEKEVLANG